MVHLFNVKKFIGFACTLSIVFSRGLTIYGSDLVSDEHKYVYGDADNNGIINIHDAAMLLQKVLKSSYKTKLETVTDNYILYLDVSNDGVLSSEDVTIVLQKVLDNSYKMPVEEERDILPEEEKIMLYVGDKELSVKWEDNASVEALKDLIKDKPLTIQMSMYGGFEQVGSLGKSLPRNDVQTVTEPGDIVLYSGNQIVMFYGSNSWAYTRLGKVINTSAKDMKELLGKGDVTITLSIDK